jgi:molybdate transport system ATP-binding protein
LLEISIKKSLPGFKLEVAFSVDREILAILGPSGSGKTMTLQCIAGLMRPDEGYIKLNDKVLLDSARKVNLTSRVRHVGFVFQNYALFPHLTAEENIAYGIKNRPRPVIKAKVADLLEKMHIGGLGQRYPRQLSAGQQQRVALARAIAPEPELLLLDEPFSALDSQVKERLELELMNLQSFYRGNILFVTHDLAEGYKLASKIAVYESGRVVQCDEKNKVIRSPVNRTVARLTGVRNIMQGTVKNIEGRTARVTVPELGGELIVKADDVRGLMLGQSVIVGIRPEYIHIVDRPGENTFTCHADRIVEGVSIINCFFHSNAESPSDHWLEVSLHKLHSPLIEKGREFYLHLAPDHIALIRG